MTSTNRREVLTIQNLLSDAGQLLHALRVIFAAFVGMFILTALPGLAVVVPSALPVLVLPILLTVTALLAVLAISVADRVDVAGDARGEASVELFVALALEDVVERGVLVGTFAFLEYKLVSKVQCAGRKEGLTSTKSKKTLHWGVQDSGIYQTSCPSSVRGATPP